MHFDGMIWIYLFSHCDNHIDDIQIVQEVGAVNHVRRAIHLSRHFTVRLHITQYWLKLGLPVKLHANRFIGCVWGCMMFYIHDCHGAFM